LPFGLRDFKLQAEYLRLTRNLDLVGTGGEPAAPGETLATTEDGLYVQGAYGVASRVAAGLRFDVVGLTNRTTVGGVASSFDDTHRLSASLTFDPTEFSRLRVQYARGSVPVGGRREAYDEFYVQFQLSLGAHGAHSF
jgi:outer membrane receptor protein involved in Fe transport